MEQETETSKEVRIEKVENGYNLIAHKDNDADKMYEEPDKYVSETREGIIKILSEILE